uniref:Transmembrane protease, serine 2 n=1 Tax=Magallana gigas TaxID=29159 RepID=K1QAG3_MAGGI
MEKCVIKSIDEPVDAGDWDTGYSSCRGGYFPATPWLGHSPILPQTYSSCGHPVKNPIHYHSDHFDRVIGGEEARMGSLPWMVMLTENGAQVCGGSVITDRLVLTAAHCFEDPESLDPRRWLAYVGKHHLRYQDLTEQKHTINQIMMHEGYDKDTARNDIAILILNERLMFNSFVMPICLPGFSLSSLLNHHSHSNHTNTNPLNITDDIFHGLEDNPRFVLNQVSLPILNDRVCGAHNWYGSEFLPQTTFCAGYEQGGKDACLGDSGGPFIIKNHNGLWVQVGITSWGYDCAQPRAPGIYTDVTMYMAWITQKAQKLKKLTVHKSNEIKQISMINSRPFQQPWQFSRDFMGFTLGVLMGLIT